MGDRLRFAVRRKPGSAQGCHRCALALTAGIFDGMRNTLTRSRENRVIAGVCAGLAERLGWRPRTVRLLFVLSCLLPGPQFLIYIVLWIIMPAAGGSGLKAAGA